MTQLVGPLGGPTSVSKGRFFISTPLLTGGPGIVDRNGVYQMSAVDPAVVVEIIP